MARRCRSQGQGSVVVPAHEGKQGTGQLNLNNRAAACTRRHHAGGPDHGAASMAIPATLEETKNEKQEKLCACGLVAFSVLMPVPVWCPVCPLHRGSVALK